jgi:hypothetical protein
MPQQSLDRMPETGLPATNTNSGGLSSVIARQRPLGDASMKGAAPAMSNPNVYKTMQPTVEKAAAGAIAGKMKPNMGRGIATASKKMQPALGRVAAKPAVGAAPQKKSIGKVIGRGLIGRR